MGGVRHQRTAERVLVLNASPIIYLCKSGLATKLQHLQPSFRLVTTTEVYHELYSRGIEKGVTAAEILRDLFDEGVIEVAAVKGGGKREVDKQISTSGVHGGEASVISLALELDATAIVDDKRAKQVSRILGVRVSGTPAIVVELVRSKVIAKGEAKRGIERMVEEGWYCSASAFSQIMGAIGET